MVRLIFGLWALLASAFGGWAQSAPQPAAPPPAAAQPTPQVQPPASQPHSIPAMTFEWVREGPAEKCGNNCREWISASGQIQGATPRLFVEFASKRNVRGATVVLNSSGGSVGGAMALGTLFRRAGVITTVGRTDKLPGEADRATLSPYGVCASMCAFVVLGGAKRHIPPEARILVHQIWPRASRGDAVAGEYSARDLVIVQRSLGALAKYVIDMGGDIELFEIALRIPPWEILRPLSPIEIDRVKLRNIPDPFDPAIKSALTAVDTQAAIAPPVSVPASRALDVEDRAWAANDVYGGPAVSRRHPLTIEGEQIGSFELAFVCSDAGVRAVYVEERKPPRGVSSSGRVLRVGIGSGKQRALLRVQSSTWESDGDLKTIAQGLVPPNFLAALGDTAGQSLIVATQTDTNVRTAIHPGNTGFGEVFKSTVAECKK